MNSNEKNQSYGLYRQAIDNNFTGDLGTEVLELHLEIRRMLVYLGMVRPDKLRGEAEVASIQIGPNALPVPGLWLGEGLGEDPGTPLYLGPKGDTLSPTYTAVGDTAIFVGIVDKDNNVLCTGIRRIPIK